MQNLLIIVDGIIRGVVYDAQIVQGHLLPVGIGDCTFLNPGIQLFQSRGIRVLVFQIEIPDIERMYYSRVVADIGDQLRHIYLGSVYGRNILAGRGDVGLLWKHAGICTDIIPHGICHVGAVRRQLSGHIFRRKPVLPASGALGQGNGHISRIL